MRGGRCERGYHQCESAAHVNPPSQPCARARRGYLLLRSHPTHLTPSPYRPVLSAAAAAGGPVSLDDITMAGGSRSSFRGVVSRAAVRGLACWPRELAATPAAPFWSHRVGLGLGLVTQEAWYHPEVRVWGGSVCEFWAASRVPREPGLAERRVARRRVMCWAGEATCGQPLVRVSTLTPCVTHRRCMAATP